MVSGYQNSLPRFSKRVYKLVHKIVKTEHKLVFNYFQSILLPQSMEVTAGSDVGSKAAGP